MGGGRGRRMWAGDLGGGPDMFLEVLSCWRKKILKEVSFVIEKYWVERHGIVRGMKEKDEGAFGGL